MSGNSIWNELQKVSEIVAELRATNSSNEKIEILERNKDNEMLANVLFFTYHPHMKYKVTLKGIHGATVSKDGSQFDNPFALCKVLAQSNINKSLRNEVATFLATAPTEEVKGLIMGMLLKQLGIGVTAKTINKVFTDLIPMFEVARGESYKNVKMTKGEYIAVTHKINGIRGVYYYDKFLSRQGKDIGGFNNIIKELHELFKAIGVDHESAILDGELVRINRNMEISDEDNFRLTSSIVNSKKRTASEEEQIEYIIFDTMPRVEFERGESTKIYTERLKDLMRIKEAIEQLGLSHVRVVDMFYKGEYSPEIIDSILEQTDEMGLEGVMINTDSTYKCRKTKDLIKVKSFYYNDVKIIGFEEGKEGKEFEGTLGAVIVDYKGFPCGVGSGFKSDERDWIWEHRDDLIGRVCMVKCKGESRNSKDDEAVSMQFPIWCGLREEGKEVSYES